MHFCWYGYLKYPNPARLFIAASNDKFEEHFDDSDEEFEHIRDVLSVLYHGKKTNHTQGGVKWAAFIIQLVNNIAAIAVAISVCIAIFVTYIGSAVYNENGPQRGEEYAWCIAITVVILLSECLVGCAFASSGIVAAVVGSCVWAALFLWENFDPFWRDLRRSLS